MTAKSERGFLAASSIFGLEAVDPNRHEGECDTKQESPVAAVLAVRLKIEV